MAGDTYPELEGWRAGGQIVSVGGRDVFVVERGRPDAPALLVLHGFPTSSFDFHRVLARLAAAHRLIVHDHLGFGYSAKPERYSYSLLEQAEVAIGLWQALGVAGGHLLAHDYGTSVATELLARRERGLLPIHLESVTLCNGSVHIELASLRVTQQLLRLPWIGPLFARLSSRTVFKAQMRQIWGDAARADDRELDCLWELLVRGDGARRLPQISSYLDERTRFWHRWIDPLTRLDLPAHVLWGRRDPVAVAAIAERLAGEIPGARLTWLETAGHYPMLEEPAAWADAALGFLGGSTGP